MQKNIFILILCLVAAGLAFLSFSAGNTGPEQQVQNNLSEDIYERSYSPSIGPEDAKVTIVEFFDPACEACRAFYPFVKQILSRHPNDVRLVLRYAAFHQGSETVIRMLEIAKTQGIYIKVLEGLLKDQQSWADHHRPNIEKAWEIAGEAGLDILRAKQEISSPHLDKLIQQENQDIRTLKVSKTPTFFVNKKPLETFGGEHLYALVVSELERNSEN